MRRLRDGLVLLAFVAVSFCYFGARLLPHPGRALVGTGIDPQIFVWAFAWWPHAIGAGDNPLVSHAVYAPQGINLAWATTTPALAVAFAPLTVAFGPSLAYNAAAVLMPALAAWTAYLLCRHITGSLWPSLVGGYLFGFSSYMLGQQLGHLHMTAVFLIPVVALVLVQFVEGELDARGLILRLGLLLGLQLWLSTEVALTLSIALVATFLLALWLVPERRARLRSLVRPVAGAYALSALIASPLLVYALLGFYSDSINDPARFNADLQNLVVPTRLIAAGGSYFASLSAHFAPGTDIERGAYLGLPALAIVAWYTIQNRRSPVARLLVAALATALVLELGTALSVGGHKLLWLPWDLVARLPIFNNVLPARFAVFSSLAVAVIVARWADSQRRAAAVALPSLAVLALVPAVWHADYRLLPERWPFFTSGLYKICFPKGETVAIFPFGFRDNSMLWQAESGFWFDQSGGYLRPKPPPDNLRDPVVRQLTFTYEDPTVPEIFDYAKRQRIDRILSVEYHAHPPGEDLKVIGPYQLLGGVLVSPACGYPPIGPDSKLASASG